MSDGESNGETFARKQTRRPNKQMKIIYKHVLTSSFIFKLWTLVADAFYNNWSCYVYFIMLAFICWIKQGRSDGRKGLGLMKFSTRCSIIAVLLLFGTSIS